MKQAIIYVFLVMAIMAFATTAMAALPDATQVTYNPSPAVPGSTITVFVQLENKDYSSNTGVTLGIETEYPFTPKEATKAIGNMESYAKASAEFTVYVDPSAENKSYNLKLKIASTSPAATKTATFPVVVSGKEPLIKVISTSEDKLTPGEEKDISLTVQNIGTSAAYDIMIELQEDRTITAAGAIIEREITPLGAAAVYVPKMNPGEQATATLKVSVNRNASLKNYTLPVEISYRNSSGTRQTDTSYIGFKVGGNVDFDSTIKEKSSEFIAGRTVDITLELFNRGDGKAEFTLIELSTDAGTIEKDKQFIGSLEPNDVDSVKAKIILDKALATGTKTLTAKITYQDTDAQMKVETLQVPIKVYSVADAATESGGMNLIIVLAIIVVVAVIGFVLYNKMQKKK
ncbi:MAG: CARDB domain-containing protein [archaeon]